MTTEKIKRVALRQQSNYESVIPNFIMFDLDLNLHDIRIYSVINSFRINHKPCCASLNWISEQTGVCARDIQRSRARLVNKGYILHFRKGRKWYFQIPSPEICTDIDDFGVTYSVTPEVTDSVTPEVTDSVTHSIKNKISSIKCSGTPKTTRDRVLLQDFYKLFKTYNIQADDHPSDAALVYLDKGINRVEDLDKYLYYLRTKCSGWLDSVYLDAKGREQTNDFRKILQVGIIYRAMNGEFEDRR
jgi:hypothetical protein